MTIISVIISLIFVMSMYNMFGEEIGAFSFIILGLAVIVTDYLRFWKIKPSKTGKIDAVNQTTVEKAVEICSKNLSGFRYPLIYLIPNSNEEIHLFGSRTIVMTSGFAQRYKDCPEKLAYIIAEQTSFINFLDNISYDIIYVSAFVLSFMLCIAGMLFIFIISLLAGRKISILLNRNVSDMISVSLFVFLMRKLVRKIMRNYSELDEVMRAKCSNQYKL